MAKVFVHYHSLLREKIGRDTEAFDLPEGSVAGDVLKEIQRRNGELERLAAILQVAINEQFSGRDHRLKDGDRVDVMPPFGGG